MGIFDAAKDKASEFASQNPDKIDEGVERAGNLADEHTGGKYADKVDQGQDFANERLDQQFGGHGDEQQ